MMILVEALAGVWQIIIPIEILEVGIEFVVEADGSVTNVKVVRGVDELLDKEAVRVVSVSPKWRPAIKNGEKVRVKYSLPVEFRLKKR